MHGKDVIGQIDSNCDNAQAHTPITTMKTALLVICGLLAAAAIAIQSGILRGTRPADIGVHNARLKPPAPTRNSVSSQAALYPEHPQREYADIRPLPMKQGSAAESMRVLAAVLASVPGIRLVEQRPDYLHAEAETRRMKFVDDLEFWANPALGVVELRSASRLGREDFGVNRERMEAIRAAYLAHP
jgi:uncharacterized protein (DUF1499 family)